ncbi:NUDIX domain-containing protein [Labrys wisconsinensis]|uniref:GDP-mannose pyrophosphatase n=1 Tax=Labrys wisconsinensis TaxID=425677 RepID=A0ABU0IYY5_9HYPH|nr:NUDIX hydrolase [Labrys wisconsinensis]MDQ0467227.1 nudix-type nucleoside diphosphatase (YffH/AdpP family) [Labrys wisconsinensis]
MTAAILEERIVHSGWNRLSMVKTRTARGSVIERSVEDHGDAVAVLPVDSVRRTAILVRQMRVPLLKAHGEQASLEAPAGILDEKDPAACARREAMEEAGLLLRTLVPLGAAYPMPGVSTEKMHLFLAEYAAADRVAEGGGLAEETEEIEVVEMPLAALAALADGGELRDLKTLLLVQTLRLRRPELFA